MRENMDAKGRCNDMRVQDSRVGSASHSIHPMLFALSRLDGAQRSYR